MPTRGSCLRAAMTLQSFSSISYNFTLDVLYQPLYTHLRSIIISWLMLSVPAAGHDGMARWPVRPSPSGCGLLPERGALTGDAAPALQDAAAFPNPGYRVVNDCQAVRRSPRKGVNHDKEGDHLADGLLRHGHVRVRQSGMGTGRRAARPGLGHQPVWPVGEVWQLPWRGGGHWDQLPP
jgi:hypothetical protein